MKPKILILGGTGMLGHKIWQYFQNRFDTYVTIKGNYQSVSSFNIFDKKKTLTNISVSHPLRLASAIKKIKPQMVINCIGIIKQNVLAKDPVVNITVNSLFPHQLAKICTSYKAKLIHISTDCVFSGDKGNYSENDAADAKDLYGRSKLLGEVNYGDFLTIRTSLIGHELKGGSGLVEWFFAQKGKAIKGYRNAIFSGLTTLQFADIISKIIINYPSINGIWHVGGKPISKFNLLNLLKKVYNVGVEIRPDKSFVCNRSLDSKRFYKLVDFKIPKWPEMVRKMYKDYVKK
ncbi:MAG: SDR family oxidoreductase [Actinobacteria bacterium]|nr:SDR family oxidoreductase [Actinomycetota bacterium]